MIEPADHSHRSVNLLKKGLPFSASTSLVDWRRRTQTTPSSHDTKSVARHHTIDYMPFEYWGLNPVCMIRISG
jgi:hypothetical protein